MLLFQTQSLSQVYILILLSVFGPLSFHFYLLWPSSLSGLNNIVKIVINVADPRCWYHSSNSTYCICLLPQDISTACVLFFPFFFVFYSLFLPPQNNSKLLNLSVCVFVSLDRAVELYPALSEWKCQEACKRKICLFSVGSPDLSAFCSASISVFFFLPVFFYFLFIFLFFYLRCAHMVVPQSQFCLFVPRFFCVGMPVCHRESKTSVWVFERISSLAFLLPFLFRRFCSFSSSHIRWLLSVSSK